ncbi:hypothetical protein [Streptomyces sp. ITFR-16]
MRVARYGSVAGGTRTSAESASTSDARAWSATAMNPLAAAQVIVASS